MRSKRHSKSLVPHASGFLPVIGLEIHVELKTHSKMFCGCRNDPFHAPKPNIYTCPVCLGLPGALPVPNKKAIEWTVKLGLALDCQINKESKFDRKHYFYPDLPKGYQISQYDQPIAVNGLIKLEARRTRQDSDATSRLAPRASRLIRIRRVHLEEDTGKLLHRTLPLGGSDLSFSRRNVGLRTAERSDPSSHGEEVSLIDFNRSGVPLVEIVTEPDIRSPEEAKIVAKKIYDMVRSLEISDADMEKGSMRLEANVSLLQHEARSMKHEAKIASRLAPRTSRLPNYKVELKNINSFRFLEKAITSELERQQRLLEKSEKIHQETRGWDEASRATKPQRTKEEAADYRYFPEPDIPPIRLSAKWISNIKNQISKMPEEIHEELIRQGVSEQIAMVVSSDRSMSRCYQAVSNQPNEIIQRFLKWLQHHKEEAGGADPFDLLDQFKHEAVSMVSDETQLKQWVDEALEEQPKAVEDYKSGKQQAFQALVGAVQKRAKGKANVQKASNLLVERMRRT